MMWIAIFIIASVGGLAAMHSHSDQRQQQLEKTVHRLVVKHRPRTVHRKPVAKQLDGIDVANLEGEK